MENLELMRGIVEFDSAHVLQSRTGRPQQRSTLPAADVLEFGGFKLITAYALHSLPAILHKGSLAY